MSNSGGTFKFHEFNIPVDLLNMTGGGTDTFEIISQMHIDNLVKFIGIRPDDSFLEIGCGIGRDAIPLTKILSSQGKYLGVDIIKRSISFCNNNITRKYSNFKFHHIDVKDQLHNPDGREDMTDIVLPIEDNYVNKIIGWSVFTHMLEKNIRHYLKEFRRVLKSGGLIYVTCFVLTPETISSARRTNLTNFNLRFEHPIGDGCYINDVDFPLGAVGYTPEKLLAMVADAGFRMRRSFVRGAWSGYYPPNDAEDGQDAMILELDSM